MLLARAQIYPFPEPHGVQNRLTVRDKIDLHAAADRIVAAGLRCVIGRDPGSEFGDEGRGEAARRGDVARGGSDPLSHDFLHLLRRSDASTAWTIVRTGRGLRVWHGTYGADLGVFGRMAEALDAALATPARSNRPAANGRRSGGH